MNRSELSLTFILDFLYLLSLQANFDLHIVFLPHFHLQVYPSNPTMPLKSDITIDAGKFDPANISEQSEKFNAYLVEKLSTGHNWYEVRLHDTPFCIMSIANAEKGWSCKIPGNAMGRRDKSTATSYYTGRHQLHNSFARSWSRYPMPSYVPKRSHNRRRAQELQGLDVTFPWWWMDAR